MKPLSERIIATMTGLHGSTDWPLQAWYIMRCFSTPCGNEDDCLDCYAYHHGWVKDTEESEDEFHTRFTDDVFYDVFSEVQRVEQRFQPFHGSHEGYSVILEELDELWGEVKNHNHDYKREYAEALDVACAAIRYMQMCRKKDPEIDDLVRI